MASPKWLAVAVAAILAVIAIPIGLTFIPSLSPMPCPLPQDFTWTSGSKSVTFTAGAGCAASLSWKFGDGATGSGTPVTHAYASASTYTVELDLIGNAGQTASVIHQVVVTTQPSQSTPIIDFTWTVSGLTVTFVPNFGNFGSGSFAVVWNFGDGSPSQSFLAGQKVQHTYARSGNYIVTATSTFMSGANTSHWVLVIGLASSAVTIGIAVAVAIAAVLAIIFVPLPILWRAVLAFFAALLVLLILFGVLPT